jgi:hypothetical protein
MLKGSMLELELEIFRKKCIAYRYLDLRYCIFIFVNIILLFFYHVKTWIRIRILLIAIPKTDNTYRYPPVYKNSVGPLRICMKSESFIWIQIFGSVNIPFVSSADSLFRITKPAGIFCGH